MNDFVFGFGYVFEVWFDEVIYKKYKGFNIYDVEGFKKLLVKVGFKDVNGDGFVEILLGKFFELLI